MWWWYILQTSAITMLASFSLSLRLAGFGRHCSARRMRGTLNTLIPRAQETASPQIYTSTSFFRFVEISEEIIEDLLGSTRTTLEAVGAKGTVLISREGYNAQLAVPAHVLCNLPTQLHAVNSQIYKDLDINLGTTIDYSLPGSPPFPFKKLVVRHKKAILTDGLQSALNWAEAGPEMPAELWHNTIVEYGSAHKAPIMLGTFAKSCVLADADAHYRLL
jgi:hypothetical protein